MTAPSTEHFASALTHVGMLADQVRTASYREALGKHARGRVCLELGGGTGILACFAARAGARRVYVIERTEIIEIAREIAARNGFAERIEFIPGNSIEVDLPRPVDLIYSELMGTDLLAGGVVEATRDAVDRCLASDGLLIPRRLKIFAVGVTSAACRARSAVTVKRLALANALSALYALDLAPLVDALKLELERDSEPLVQHLGLFEAGPQESRDQILTSEATVAEIDLLDIDPTKAISSTLELEVLQAGVHDAMARYWTAWLDDTTALSTSPASWPVPPNWGGQVITPIKPQHAEPGMALHVDATISFENGPETQFARRNTAP